MFLANLGEREKERDGIEGDEFEESTDGGGEEGASPLIFNN